MLNRYPYTNGHLMVAPIAHEARLFDSRDDSLRALIRLTAEAQRILSDVYHPDGFNVGMNFGQVAGAGVADHYHMHIVPRWGGDSNFMTVTAQHAPRARGARRDVRQAPAALQKHPKGIVIEPMKGRTIIAMLLAFLVPGAGHLYLGRRARASPSSASSCCCSSIGLAIDGDLYTIEHGNGRCSACSPPSARWAPA